MGKLYNFGWMGLSLFTIVVMLKLNSKVASMARKLSDIKIPDEHVYRTVEGDCVVVLDNTGKNGEWNRAQRGLHNWTEGPLIVMQAEVLLIAFAIGASGFILATLIGMSRILFTVGYSRDTKKRIPGFVLSATLENAAHFLILFLSIKAGFKSGL
ncbi:hypothetical protein ScalyP_jg5814 [Parmales sp. scaly parma]|nr:hypothetical protein ScalyP_jg5814 [Parmales sp. scaly parma]